MPIEYSIDHTRRLVSARGHGILGEDDVFAYQKEVWSRPEVAGFNEIMDMTDVVMTGGPPKDGLRRLAQLSASMDPATPKSKFAIVAPQLLAFGLGRMYEAYRAMEQTSTKEVGVFRTMQEAFVFLGIVEAGAN